MNRRQFLQLGSLGALSLYGVRSAKGESARHGGPYFIALHADGGIDQTLLCDAKSPSAQLQQNLYRTPKRLSSGLLIAPVSLKNQGVTLDTVESFFDEVGGRFLCINGIDTQTNNHEVGVRHVWGGHSSSTLPSIAALHAASVQSKLRLPATYLSMGGYDVTDGVIPLTRLAGGNVLVRSLHVGVVDPEAAPDDRKRFFSAQTESRLAAARRARMERLSAQPQPYRVGQSIRSFRDAREGTEGFSSLAKLLPARLVEVADAFPKLPKDYVDYDLRSYLQSIQLALLAFQSGQAASASIATYGFDTHSAHDDTHPRWLGRLLLTIRYLMTQAEAMGIAKQLYVVVGTDFGRTPLYNAGGGKDHWNVGSMMIAGPGILGGRSIGATDDALRPLSVNPDDPSVVLGYDDPRGTRIVPAHIQRALRKRLGITGSPLDVAYPLLVERRLDQLLG